MIPYAPPPFDHTRRSLGDYLSYLLGGEYRVSPHVLSSTPNDIPNQCSLSTGFRHLVWTHFFDQVFGYQSDAMKKNKFFTLITVPDDATENFVLVMKKRL